ncbi:MAG: response regulator transcription factor [Oscillospiraceae bacterium]|nr:response regulator transcription factor [Oscillospiraceae bacterium]
MKETIYIADDESSIRELLTAFLVSDGYEVTAFANGEALLEAFRKHPADLVILDIMMPGKDGLTCCRELRERTNVPIIMLTARDSELDYVQGITIGSDDYLVKPFRPTILLMRVKALLRRMDMNGKSDETSIDFGDLSYHSDAHLLYCHQQQLQLTKLELRVLTYMMQQPEKAFSREELLQNIWDYGDTALVESRVTDETLRRIRKKLSAAGSSVFVESIWGFGYRLNCSSSKESVSIS